jgi:uncharacterized membrane protein
VTTLHATLPPASSRFDTVDAVRGLAVVWMTVFHFCFDLNAFGYIRQNFLADPFWTTQRTAIVSLFLFTAGVGQAIATGQGQGWPRFWRRWAQVAGCAVLVSVGSWWMYPKSYIHFGVLHGLAVMLVVVRLSAGWGRGLWVAGLLAVALPFIAKEVHLTLGNGPFSALLDGKPLNALGLVSRKPFTEDYVPVFPWLGVLWWGMAAGQTLLRARPPALTARLPAAAKPLVWLGRWSLSWYMLHQPVLIGAFMALAALR